MSDGDTEVASVTTLVNVAGSGDLDVELDLDALFRLFKSLESVSELSDSNSRITLSFENTEGTVGVFRTGKYNIMGSSSCDSLKNTNERLIGILVDSGVIDSPTSVSFSRTNYVYTVDFEREINLNSLDILLGTEAEYEPEQYPFLIYRPSTLNCTMTLSSSGKCVVNSPKGRETVEMALDLMKTYLKE
jgi:transcription initiation factor TFIID TATA-box-binding protein